MSLYLVRSPPAPTDSPQVCLHRGTPCRPLSPGTSQGDTIPCTPLIPAAKWGHRPPHPQPRRRSWEGSPSGGPPHSGTRGRPPPAGSRAPPSGGRRAVREARGAPRGGEQACPAWPPPPGNETPSPGQQPTASARLLPLPGLPLTSRGRRSRRRPRAGWAGGAAPAPSLRGGAEAAGCVAAGCGSAAGRDGLREGLAGVAAPP